MLALRKFTAVAAAGVAIALVASGLAAADTASVDGDGLAPVSTSALSFGFVCANTTTSKQVVFAVERAGSPSSNNVFASGGTNDVTVVIGRPSDPRLAAAFVPPSGHTIDLPADWSTRSNSAESDVVTSTVTFTAGAAGTTLDATIAYTANGTATTGGTLSKTTDLRVTAAVQSCDTQSPTLNLPTHQMVEATSAAGAAVTYRASATDAAPASPVVDCAPLSGSTFAIGTTTVSCSATDAAGNTASGSFAITVQDTTGPVIAGTPASIAAEATSAAGASVEYVTPSATDAVDGSRDVTCTPTSGSAFPLGTTDVTCSAADTRSNTATSGFSVTVSDSTDPMLVVPANREVEATGPTGAPTTFTAAATDTVDGAVEVACTPPSGTTFPLGTSAVTCTATDDSGNVVSDSFDIDVVDTTAPAVTVPASFSREATSAAGAAVPFAASALDVVDGALDVSCDRSPGSTFPLGATTVACAATDEAGNTNSASFTITVVDTTAPVLSLPADQEEEAVGPAGRVFDFFPTSNDLADGSVAVTCNPSSGSAFPVGTTTVVCTATDARGNSSSGSFTVTVTDATAPVVDVPEDMVVEATGPDGATVDFTSMATDLVDGALVSTCLPTSGSTFALGDTGVTCSVTDAAGNLGEASFSVSVVDTTAPTIAGTPGLTSIEATGPAGADVTYTSPTATDVVDGDVAVTCLPTSGSAFALGETTVSCSAEDDTGNGTTTSFTVTVRDTTAPVLSLPSVVTAEATGPAGAVVGYEASATDIVDGDLPVACEPTSGSQFQLGSTSVECSTVDAAGNDASGGFEVRVVDRTAPAVNVPADMVVEATSAAGAAVGFTVTATDVVDGDVTPVCSPASGTTFALGLTTVTCTATDDAGNTSEPASFDVTVVDTTAPVVDVPDDIVTEATSALGAPVAFTSTAVDLVDGAVVPTCSPLPGGYPLGTTTVMCTAVDAAQNAGSASFTVTVRDTTPPALTVPSSPVVVEATGPDGAVVPFTANAVDAVDGVITPTCAPASGATFALGVTTVSCEVSDAAGNTGTAVFAVDVRDTTGPTIGMLTNLEQEATGPGGATVTFADPTATDLVDGPVSVTCDPTSGNTFPLGETTVTCTAVDEAGNPTDKRFSITVTDETAPALQLPDDITAEATGPQGSVVAFDASASDLVDGDVPVRCAPPTGSTFGLGTTTVTCSTADARGNSATGGFSITVEDTTAPALVVPGDQVAEATGPTGAAVSFAVSASDVVDDDLEPTCSADPGQTFGLGTTVVACEVTDAAGNTAAGSFTVTVRDTTQPLLTLPVSASAVATSAAGAAVSWSASASDVVDGAVPPVCEPGSGATFAAGMKTVTCTATDAAGNTASGTFVVAVTFDLGNGFLSPVNAGTNSARAGSTVPLKWQMPIAGGFITTTAVVNGFRVMEVACGTGTDLSLITATETGGTTLRYDAAANQFVQNWQTPRRSGMCLRAEIVLTGGQVLSASFSLR